MTHDDHVLDLFTRGDPMAEPTATTSDVSGSDYLRDLKRRSSTMTLTTADTPNATSEPPKRKWTMIAASVAAVALVGGLIVVAAGGGDEVVPADESDPTVPASDPVPETTEPAVDADGGVEPLPVVSGSDTVLVSGRYSTDLLGVDLEFEVSDELEYLLLTSARAGMLQFADGYPERLTTRDDYTVDRAVTISFQRLAGWSTPEEATLSRPDAASIDANDVDTWIERNDVTVVADRDITVDGRSVRVLDVAVDEPAEIAPLGCVDVDWQCTYYGATAEPASSARSRQDALTVSPFRATRFWVIPVSPSSVESTDDDGSVPLLVTVTVPKGSGEYLDAFEDGVIGSMTFDGDAAPIGWTAPTPSEDGESNSVETDDAVESSDPQLEEATALLDGWVAARNAGDADAVAELFVPDAVLITSDGIERTGERAGEYIARFVSMWPTLARVTDGRPTDDGAISFDIEWTSPSGTIVPRTFFITTADGALVLMDERLTVDD